jgi:transposase InsO family protein
MIALLIFLLRLLVLPSKPKRGLEAENAALRRQLAILQRKVRSRVQLTQPETLVRWHRAGFRRYWRWKSVNLGGRPPISGELRALIRRMSLENALWGAPHIHGELLKLGFVVAQSTVAKYMAEKGADPPSGRAGARLRNHMPHIAAIDLFVVPTIGFRLLYALVIVRLARRELVWINVTAHPTAEWIAQQITEAFPWDEAPRYLIRDRDAVYGSVVTRRLRATGIRDKPISAGSPWQNGFAERLIGTVRRECVDHLIVLGEAHLRQVLIKFATYYNECRIHRAIERLGAITSRPVLGGLHHQYCRAQLSAHWMRFSVHTGYSNEPSSLASGESPSRPHRVAQSRGAWS